MNLEIVNQHTREAYNKAAEKYNQLFFDEMSNKEYDRALLDEFASCFKPGSLILDAGCGPCGHISNYLTKKNLRVIGLDISEKCVEIASRTFPDMSFVQGDFAKMNFADNYFDGVIAYYSLVDTPKESVPVVLKEFRRVLKPGGMLFLVVKEGTSEGYEKELLGIETDIYFSLFTESEIKNLLTESGMEIVKLEKRAPYPDEIQIDRIYSICINRQSY